MISFYICDNITEYNNIETKQNDTLYFVKGYGIFKGTALCTEYNSNILSDLITEVGKLADLVDNKVDTTIYSSKIQALEKADSDLQGAINTKLDVSNHSTSIGTFTMGATNGSGTAKFQYNGNALTITLS